MNRHRAKCIRLTNLRAYELTNLLVPEKNRGKMKIIDLSHTIHDDIQHRNAVIAITHEIDLTHFIEIYWWQWSILIMGRVDAHPATAGANLAR